MIQVNSIKDLIDGSVITDDSTPLGLLKETFSSTSNQIYSELMLARNIYPSRAVTTEDVMGHLSDKELENIFSSPPSTILTFFLNKKDIIKYGKHDGDNISVAIPEGTTISVDEIYFTIRNEVKIKLISGVPLAETKIYDGIEVGVLKSSVMLDKDNIEYVVVDLPIKQYRSFVYESNLISDVKYEAVIDYEDKYSDIEIIAYDEDGNKVVFERIYVDEIYDDTPKARITILENQVKVEILAMHATKYSGSLTITVYTTIGDVTVPLNAYHNKEYNIVLGKYLSEEATSMSNITLSVNASIMLSGGASAKTIDEIRNDIIFRANGNREFPITEYDIKELGRSRGIRVRKELDIITIRLYSGSRPTEVDLFKLQSAPMHVMGVCELVMERLSSSFVNFYNNSIIVNSGALLKAGKTLTLLTLAEENEFLLMDNNDKIDYINGNDLMYSQFQYMIGYDDGLTYINVYDTDNIGTTSLDILDKKISDKYSINILDTNLVRLNNGFEYIVRLIGNENGGTLLNNGLEIDMVIGGKLLSSTKIEDGIYKFFIESNGYVDSDNKLLLVINGEETTVECETRIEFYIHNKNFITSSSTTPSTYEISNEYGVSTEVFTKQSAILTLLLDMKYVWKNCVTGFLQDEYKKYEEDVYARYDEDVYKVLDNGCIIEQLSDGSLNSIKLHSKGDIIYDDDGEPIIIHRKNDTIITDGEAELDIAGHLFNKLDMIVTPYKYLYNKSSINVAEMDKFKTLLTSWLNSDYKTVNDALLERTTVMYKPNYGLEKIPVKVGKRTYYKEPAISPKVYLNTASDRFTTLFDKAKLTKLIGDIITKELNNETVRFSNIRDAIMDYFGASVTGIVIKDFVVDMEAELFSSEKAFYIKRKLKYNGEVSYDLDVIVSKVL